MKKAITSIDGPNFPNAAYNSVVNNAKPEYIYKQTIMSP